MEIELKLGSEFYADGAAFKVTEGKCCADCAFFGDDYCVNENNLVCSGEFRKDKTDVIFVEADE